MTRADVNAAWCDTSSDERIISRGRSVLRFSFSNKGGISQAEREETKTDVVGGIRKHRLGENWKFQ